MNQVLNPLSVNDYTTTKYDYDFNILFQSNDLAKSRIIQDTFGLDVVNVLDIFYSLYISYIGDDGHFYTFIIRSKNENHREPYKEARRIFKMIKYHRSE